MSPYPDDLFSADWLGDPADPGEPAFAADPGPPPVSCWRCGLPVAAVSPRCPHCAAVSRSPHVPQAAAGSGGRERAGVGADLHAVLVAYLVMLTTSVVWGWVVWFGPPLDPGGMRTGTAILEIVDTMIVVVLFAHLGRVRPVPGSGAAPVAAWVVAWPALGVLLAVNFAFAAVVRWLLPHAPVPPPEPLTAVNLLLSCVQPAVVEELFFRYLALGVLARATNTHAAIGTSAALFAVAHLYNPLGMPYLFVVGVVLAYLRVASGGLALPMAVHFAHNLVVLVVEGAR